MWSSLTSRRRIAAPLLVVATALLGAPAANAEARQAPVAVTINDPAGPKSITVAEVKRWSEIAARSSGRGPSAGRPTRQERSQAMQLLVSIAWIEGEARAYGITVTEEEARKSFEEQKQQSFPKDADFRRFLRSSGQTKRDILDRVRLDLLSNKIRDRVVGPAEATVTDAAVDAYIEAKGPFEEPEQRDLRVVLTKTRAAAQSARDALERGATWSSVARRYSVDKTSARRGGLLRRQAKGTLDKSIDRAVFRARRGKLLGPIKTEYGYHVVKVVRIRPAHPTPRAELRTAVRQTLVSEAQQKALVAFVKDFTARWKTRTICAPAYDSSRDCGNWDGNEPRGIG